MKLIAFLVAAFFFFIIPSSATSQEISPTPPQENPATASAAIKYDLAFPGMLPDHPFYKLKVLRDKIAATLISEPKKKIDFYLLQTDKGILASAMLVDKKNYDLAAQTALKAEHNYTLITQELYRLPTRPNESFFKKLNTASLKHQEVMASLAKRVPKEKQKTFLTIIDFSKRNWKTIEKYKELEEETEDTKSAEIKTDEE